MERLGWARTVALSATQICLTAGITAGPDRPPMPTRPRARMNYIAITGLLHASTTDGSRAAADWSAISCGGALSPTSAFGLLAGVIHARGRPRPVVDCAMSDARLSDAIFYGFTSSGMWKSSGGAVELSTAALLCDPSLIRRQWISIAPSSRVLALMLEKSVPHRSGARQSRWTFRWPSLPRAGGAIGKKNAGRMAQDHGRHRSRFRSPRSSDLDERDHEHNVAPIPLSRGRRHLRPTPRFSSTPEDQGARARPPPPPPAHNR